MLWKISAQLKAGKKEMGEETSGTVFPSSMGRGDKNPGVDPVAY